LSDQEVAEVLAAILKSNGFPAGGERVALEPNREAPDEVLITRAKPQCGRASG